MDLRSDVTQPIVRAGVVAKQSFRALLRDPQILAYPTAAFVFISITYPLLGTSIFASWYDRVVSEASSVVPHNIGFLVGLAGFSVFYAATVSAFFTCAVSASVLAKLDGQKTKPLFGLVQVFRQFFRVACFCLLAIFMFPIGLYSQHRKLPQATLGVLGSSFSLNMGQVAPGILTRTTGVFATIAQSIETIGRRWKELLALKIGMYLTFTAIFILPQMIQGGFFSNPSADKISWLISLELGVSSYGFFKVLSSIFATVLYHQASQSKK